MINRKYIKNTSKVVILGVLMLFIFSLSSTINYAQTSTNAKINFFTASATKVNESSQVMLSWDTTNISKVSIKSLGDGESNAQIPQNLPVTGSINLRMTESQIFVLQAYDANGDIIASTVTVNVTHQPDSNVEITSFTTSENNVQSGTSVTLNWATKNATKCEIITSDGIIYTNRAPNGSLSIEPDISKGYTLVAYNEKQAIVEKSLVVSVFGEKYDDPLKNEITPEGMLADFEYDNGGWITSNANGSPYITNSWCSRGLKSLQTDFNLGTGKQILISKIGAANFNFNSYKQLRATVKVANYGIFGEGLFVKLFVKHGNKYAWKDTGLKSIRLGESLDLALDLNDVDRSNIKEYGIQFICGNNSYGSTAGLVDNVYLSK